MPKFALTRDAVRVAYESTGRGPPLVLVHGIGDERAIWEPIVRSLSAHYTCVTLDLRGHGQSTGPARYAPFELAHDLEAVISDAALRKPALVGHSLGAFVATMYAATTRNQVRAVLNVEQPLQLDGLAPSVKAHEAALRAGRLCDVFFALLGPEGTGPLPAALRERLEASREQLPAEVVLGIWGPFLEAQHGPMQARVELALPRIKAPYLSLFGQRVAPTYESWLRALIGQAELECWSGLGHFLHLVEPARFSERVRQFVG